jgi:hypothetical protein
MRFDLSIETIQNRQNFLRGFGYVAQWKRKNIGKNDNPEQVRRETGKCRKAIGVRNILLCVIYEPMRRD